MFTPQQVEHLNKVYARMATIRKEQPCAHDNCPSCLGTGKKLDGTACVHNLYCSCPKCSPKF